ncbi:hypothetical protein [Candidatus Nanohalovita haloferacivicina]|uniref:hypothetical protein n=1 Tax=Candidatus Nanohalovita haloferacivicina TaxID=2978046 RepID=UPI00325F9B38|nr:hypothetical protein HBNXNv_0810 [Candidatus Nanohalobia archaeon BNXNv]
MLFDNRGNSDSKEEEVSISPAQDSSSRSRDNETEINRGRGSSNTSSSGSSGGSDDGGIAIPSASGDGNAVDESQVSLEDIHEQNKKIIGLLESLTSNESSGSAGKESDDKLKGDIENELL